MRRPLSIMRADASNGWIEILYKVKGPGLKALSQRKPGEQISVLGPIGKSFTADAKRPRAMLVGGGVGIPPLVFFAERLRENLEILRPLALFGSEIPFPFKTRPSTILLPAMPAGVIACMPLLDDWGIPSRLASLKDYPGCYAGYVTALLDLSLAASSAAQLAETEVFSCGPTPMLQATVAVARKYGVPVQVSLEEYMACAVGGCAGCAVRVETADGPAMKRVCVDGPVFDGYSVFTA